MTTSSVVHGAFDCAAAIFAEVGIVARAPTASNDKAMAQKTINNLLMRDLPAIYFVVTMAPTKKTKSLFALSDTSFGREDSIMKGACAETFSVLVRDWQ